MKFIILAAAFICSSLARNIEVPTRVGRIVGGSIGNAQNFQYQAFLDVQTEITHHYCGGSIISNQFILTSAHCIEHGFEILASVGVQDLSNTAEASRQSWSIGSKHIIVHEDFDGTHILNEYVLKLFLFHYIYNNMLNLQYCYVKSSEIYRVQRIC